MNVFRVIIFWVMVVILIVFVDINRLTTLHSPSLSVSRD